MPLWLLAVLVAVALLLGLAVGTMVRDIHDQRRRARLAEQATLHGRVKAGVRASAGRASREAAKATRKGMFWMLRRRLLGKPEE